MSIKLKNCLSYVSLCLYGTYITVIAPDSEFYCLTGFSYYAISKEGLITLFTDKPLLHVDTGQWLVVSGTYFNIALYQYDGDWEESLMVFDPATCVVKDLP